MKTYTAKSSLLRSLKQQGIDPETQHLNQGSEGWYAVPKEVAKPAAKKERNGNVARAWAYFETIKGKGLRRKDAVAGCMALGIPKGTSNSQYQSWREAEGLVCKKS